MSIMTVSVLPLLLDLLNRGQEGKSCIYLCFCWGQEQCYEQFCKALSTLGSLLP